MDSLGTEAFWLGSPVTSSVPLHRKSRLQPSGENLGLSSFWASSHMRDLERVTFYNDPTTFRSGRKFSTSSPWLFVLFESGPVPAASGLHGSERPTHGAPPRVPDSGAPLSSGLRGCRVIGGFPSDPRVVSSPGLSFLFPRRETHNVPVTERIPESLAQIIGDRQPQRSPGRGPFTGGQQS